ncbi:TetR/AcrR family transcriptional regulator [Aquabacter sp. CN5-332]|uniref:TetR/AcrR family transcriptional regulator n=1 Tax=Aquabacter sp. CN5-332 TaxID=3156608 RepID=UPI0032B59CF7
MAGQKKFERVAQKQKTRQSLLDAARILLDEGHSPTVTEAADKAGISRATAYRYFSTPEALAQEAVLERLGAEMDSIVFAMSKSAEPEDAAAEAISRILAMVVRNEALFRAYLSLVASGERASNRDTRRVRWLTTALAPLAGGLPKARFERLVNALSVLAGIEALVVLKDVCALDPEKTEETVRWMVRALVKTTLDE